MGEVTYYSCKSTLWGSQGGTSNSQPHHTNSLRAYSLACYAQLCLHISGTPILENGGVCSGLGLTTFSNER